MNAQWNTWLLDGDARIAKKREHAAKKLAAGDIATAERHTNGAAIMEEENAEVRRRLETMTDEDQATAALHALGNEHAPCLGFSEYWDGSLTY